VVEGRLLNSKRNWMVTERSGRRGRRLKKVPAVGRERLE